MVNLITREYEAQIAADFTKWMTDRFSADQQFVVEHHQQAGCSRFFRT
jgi:hypothetical protein